MRLYPFNPLSLAIALSEATVCILAFTFLPFLTSTLENLGGLYRLELGTSKQTLTPLRLPPRNSHT